ncbi:hypothetical protein JJJ17_14970 [Paracoccus caeni]|uniref:Uncharacterized protein n=1 Tax=Paracoccus caeni TaxID=657651 RepID=A0A934VZP1_9RHOB|nr:hypothetical protein [Paracoccus caeni]MBK4217232.1 hypothetical protein [Paracoccus caeni]
MKRFLPIAGFCAAMLPLTAQASSDDAWQEFQANVDTACRALVEAPDDAEVTVEVNPFGSESFGAALVTVSFGDAGEDRMVCIYDKQSGDAEMTGAFTPAETDAEAANQ